MTVALLSDPFDLCTGYGMMIHNELSQPTYNFNAGGTGKSNSSMNPIVVPSYDRSCEHKPIESAAAAVKSQKAWKGTNAPAPHLAVASKKSASTDSEQPSMSIHGHRAIRSASSRRRSSAPPKNSTDALARWFAELISWIWFSPSSSSLVGASRPMTPARSPTASFAPHQSSPLSSTTKKARSVASAFSGGDDRFTMLGGSIGSTSSSATAAPSYDSDLQLRRGTPNLEGWPSTFFDDGASLERRFHPEEKFVAFIRDTIKTTQVSTSVLILALLYVQRLKLQHPKLRGQEGSEYRLSVTAMMLGNKFLDDHTYTNKTWSDISGIPLKDITKMEIEFWLGLQMRIHVHKTEYEAWLQTIDDLFGQRSDALWKRETVRRKTVVPAASPRPYPTTRYPLSTLGFPLSSDVPFAPQSALPQTWNLTSSCRQHTSLGPHEYGAVTSPSPPSHYSSFSSTATASSTASSYATSSASTKRESAFQFSPDQRRMSARKLSPLSTIGRPVPAIPSSVSGYDFTPALMTTGWQYPMNLPRLSSAGLSGGNSTFDGNAFSSSARKRGRGDVFDATEEGTGPSEGRESKRMPPSEGVSYDTYPSHAYSRVNSPGFPPQHQDQIVPCTHDAHQAVTPTSPNDSVSRNGSVGLLGSASQDEALYRSIFADPLTPECLTQGYVGPHGLSSCLRTSQGEERGLAFYQLAAGNNLGLPALHLPPPAAYLGGPTYNASTSVHGNSAAAATMTSSAMTAARRGSLNLAAFASPCQSWPAMGPQHHHHQPGTVSLGQSPSRRYGYTQPQRPVRHSPEAYGLFYCNSAPPSGPNHDVSKGSPAGHGDNVTARGPSQYAAESSSDDKRGRWMPFNNVPMNMQLEQMQQWHHIQYQQQLRAQEDEERRRRSVGCYFGTGRP